MRIKLFTAVFLLTFAAVPVLVLAAEFRVGERPAIGRIEAVQDNVYLAGGSATSIGSVSGDLIAAGGNVLITGNVGQDVAAVGGNVTITRTVNGDVRAAGGNVNLEGVVVGDVVGAGGQIHIGGEIGGDVVIVGGALRVDAPIQKSLRFWGGDVYIDAPISGAVEIEADRITLGKNAVIGGAFRYTSAEEAVLESGARVVGETTYTPRSRSAPMIPSKTLFAIFSILTLLKFLAALAGALVIGLLLKRYSARIISAAIKQPFMELGRGLIVLIVLPVASVILSATIIGIPFGIVGILSYIILLITSYLIAPILVGSCLYKWMLRRKDYDISWLTILVGAVAFSILEFIPFIGWIVILGLTLQTLGAMTRIKLDILAEWR